MPERSAEKRSSLQPTSEPTPLSFPVPRGIPPSVVATEDRAVFSPLSVRSGQQRLAARASAERRKRWFERDPLCAHCREQGRVTLAEELDHVVPLAKGGLDADENLQGLCRECHYIKTQRDFGKSERAATGADGWPADAALSERREKVLALPSPEMMKAAKS